MAIVAALAVLVTVFTLIRDRGAPVMSASCAVEKCRPRATLVGKPSAAGPPVVVSVVGLVHTPAWSRWRPGADRDAVQAAGGAVNGADTAG
ncbi:hypothetical protein L839_0774 [Mycobacterium avium MAV_120809_2495]|uniref:hypothetical protein n=1 Tax=Mycobacterium avium TaxID=1764 RepID=UPI00044ACEBB|nr:hypothetical protein L839_0774 [Mycobacterium avium MAV_120809_2495]